MSWFGGHYYCRIVTKVHMSFYPTNCIEIGEHYYCRIVTKIHMSFYPTNGIEMSWLGGHYCCS